MKMSRPFLIVVSILLVVTGGVYYFFTQATFFNHASAQNVNVSELDSYLLKNYSFQFNLQKRQEEAIRIYCDPLVATTTTGGVTIGYPCQNQNPTHKIIIGWASINQGYVTVMRALGNEMLYWKNYGTFITEEGDIACTERGDYGGYKSIVFGLDCVLTTSAGEKLFSSAFFLEPKNNREIQSFIVVTNTVKSSSAQKVEQELLTLVSDLQETTNLSFVPDLFTKNKNLTEEEKRSASSSALFSSEADSTSRSFSVSSITQDSGNGVDATVCDVTDLTNCYPLYCESLTSVWNYSLNKCIEPEVVNVAYGEKNCPLDAPVWDGSRCRLLTGNIISSNSCAIPVGESSCSMNIFWSVQFPKNVIEVKRVLSSTESLILTTGERGSLRQEFTYQKEPYKLELFDGKEKLHDGKFTTVCARGGWDSFLKKCIDPQVTKISISGEYYLTPSIFNFSCSDADHYILKHGDTDTTIATGTYFGAVTIPVIKSGNYSIACGSGDYTGNPIVRYYNAPPPPLPTITFNIFPRTISKNEKSLLVWDIDFPEDTCKITAKVICKNNICTDDQKQFENETNLALQQSVTDEDDPGTSRLMSSAVTTIAPSHVDVDWKAVGQKTLSITYTTDFTLSCENVPPQRKRVYVRGGRE